MSSSQSTVQSLKKKVIKEKVWTESKCKNVQQMYEQMKRMAQTRVAQQID